MDNKARVQKTIFQAIDQVNKFLPKDQRFQKSLDTPVFGYEGTLDSLGFANFIAAVERQVEEEFKRRINLIRRDVDISEENNPFRTIETLINYISQLLAKK